MCTRAVAAAACLHTLNRRDAVDPKLQPVFGELDDYRRKYYYFTTVCTTCAYCIHESTFTFFSRSMHLMCGLTCGSVFINAVFSGSVCTNYVPILLACYYYCCRQHWECYSVLIYTPDVWIINVFRYNV